MIERIVRWLFGSTIDRLVREAYQVRDDELGWRVLSGASRHETPWHKRQRELEKALEAWRSNPLARRLVTLGTDYSLGEKGIQVGSDISSVDKWVKDFWGHPENHMALRLREWSDELARSGELFIVLSRNPADGMSYVRTVPALLIDEIETDPEDVERPLRFHQLIEGRLEGRWWPAAGHAGPAVEQVMLHGRVNVAPGLVRGQSDLLPLLPWIEHYSVWLEDRVRVNRLTSAFVWKVTLAGASPAVVAAKKAEYGRPPTPGSIVVTNEGETWEALRPEIQAGQVEADGKALRLMFAAGAGVPLHFLSEGESATRATAAEMGDPTFRRYRRRQGELVEICRRVVATAYERAVVIGKVRRYRDLRLRFEAPDIERVDREELGRSSRLLVEAVRSAREAGWINDELAAKLAMRAFNEPMSDEAIRDMIRGVAPDGGEDGTGSSD